VATALAEQRPDLVAALALIDTGPDSDAFIPQGLLSRLLLAPLPGRLLWPLRIEATIRKAMRTAFTRPVDIPDALIEDARGMTHRALTATSRASLSYLRQRSLPARLAALGVPMLVIFGTDDHRWRSSSATAYDIVPGARVELLPGVGHTPMLELATRPMRAPPGCGTLVPRPTRTAAGPGTTGRRPSWTWRGWTASPSPESPRSKPSDAP
jgi:pimeloyl-ACP methyl ester carboxylesterase